MFVAGLMLLASSMGFFLAKNQGAILGGASIAFFLLLQACTGRWQLQKKTQAKPFFSSESSLDLWIYPDLFPAVLTVKSLGTSGSVFLSQAMVSILTQKQLEELLEDCRIQLKYAGWSSFHQTLVFFFFNLLPSSLAGCLLLKPDTRKSQGTMLPLGESILFLLFFPWIQGLLFLAQNPCSPKSSEVLKKIEQRIQTWGILGSQPLLTLHRFHPRIQESSLEN
jgi:hypothetical protein